MRHFAYAGLGLALLAWPALAQDHVTNPIEARIAKGDVAVKLQPVAEGLGSAVWGTAPKGDDRLFVVDQFGHVRVLKGGKLLERPFLDATPHMTKLRNGFDERGLLNPGKAVPTLKRCAELGGMHVHDGRLPFPDLERF